MGRAGGHMTSTCMYRHATRWSKSRLRSPCSTVHLKFGTAPSTHRVCAGGRDTIPDTPKVIDGLPKTTRVFEVPSYEHMDFMYSRSSHDTVYPKVAVFACAPSVCLSCGCLVGGRAVACGGKANGRAFGSSSDHYTAHTHLHDGAACVVSCSVCTPAVIIGGPKGSCVIGKCRWQRA